MLQPLFFLLFAEVFVILLLLYRTPLQKPLLRLLDWAKSNRGPMVASMTAGGILFVILASILYGIINTQKQLTEGSPLNVTDQFILAYHLHEASLLGVTLFLGLMIGKLPYYIKERKETGDDDGKNKWKLKAKLQR
ncbi:uncharacterized protein LOC111380399 [Olea europaea var. sylvestris]|uniref:Endoplasmic reticulum transmembrane protein n=1 Tax=Olea europaea subsp. europaea TaxID=158383 RepID=A0A8S0U185_OLEEU|nr:uncharacterized protein LOC111380399 [Olea europaea var. sylvestris]CAA3009841.1 uncharacterized protein LOC111380399 [Olea europaea subsp. europaea]